MADTSHLDPRFKKFEKEYNAVVQCNRCGFCETACPTYVVSGKETLSPRGRNQAFRQILEGKIANPESAAKVFSTCLTCHACTNVCFAQVPVAKLMAQARSIAQARKLKWPELFVYRVLLFHRKLFSVFMWVGMLLKNIGVSGLFRKLGILGKLSPELEAADALFESLPFRFGAGSSSSSVPAKVAYFSGCGIHYVYPEASRATLEQLRLVSRSVLTPNHACCGLPANSAGDLETAKKLARKNVREFLALGVETIVVNDDSCCGFLRNYPELLDGDPDAALFAQKVKNLSEFLVEKELRRSESHLTAGLAWKVTYHDPCQMGNGQKQFQAPRKVLQGIHRVEFVEMEESNWCCGGAGTYCLKHPRLADDVLERKINNIAASQADIVVTQASSCLMHIQYGLRKKGLDQQIEALHLGEFLKRARR